MNFKQALFGLSENVWCMSSYASTKDILKFKLVTISFSVSEFKLYVIELCTSYTLAFNCFFILESYLFMKFHSLTLYGLARSSIGSSNTLLNIQICFKVKGAL